MIEKLTSAQGEDLFHKINEIIDQSNRQDEAIRYIANNAEQYRYRNGVSFDLFEDVEKILSTDSNEEMK